MNLYKAGFCPACGTRVFSYKKEVLDFIEQMLINDEEITIVSEIENCSAMTRFGLKQRKFKLGPNANHLDAPLGDGVLGYKYKVEERTNGYQDDLRITNTFWIDTDFKNSRLDYDRVELAVYEYNRETIMPNVHSSCLCPLCGHITLSESGYGYTLKRFIDFEKEQCCSIAEKFVADMKSNAIPSKTSVGKDEIDIKQYLGLLIEIETEIYYFTDRLKSLYIAQKETGRAALKEKLKASFIAREEIELTLKKVKAEKSNLKSKHELLSLDFAPEDVGLIMPEKPEIKKPGLFNKKKIEAENKQANEQYERALAVYNDEWAKLQKEELDRRVSENTSRTMKLQEEEKMLNDEIFFLEKQKKCAIDVVPASGKQRADSFCLVEIAEVKEKIQELCKVRAQLISLDIIYPKYLDFVAITTIAEYLETGRCDSLEGANGAYNLYEREVRANRVIAQLDQVLESLEEIKQNQYKAYTVLLQVSKDMSAMSEKMTSAVKSLSNISKNTDNIKETNEQIAYNTAKTAYYSKVNAELTNALGYIMAFN